MSRAVRLAGHGGDELGALHWPGPPGAPGVLIVHDARGLDGAARSAGQRIAELGWAALAPDLFARAGGPGAEPLPDRRAVADLEAAAAWLAGEGGADPERVAVVGYGMGGNLAFLLGCQSRRVAAVVDHYGPLVYGELSREKPVQPLEMALGLQAPLLAHFGEADETIPREHVERLRSTLAAFAKPLDLHTYPGAAHGFADPALAAWSPTDATRAWDASVAFLREALDAPG